ncbi:hypothetical protein CROQUDRAFT_723200 [Cronartium quercuum f. sp. fusiforme G11]|uniref:Lysophospholipase n=1 Tax=Cronartium quercuum f. sp. fusiforme G11 TaxID=708437 RepID=A0A9P6NKL1_9BASI|nr:hypothetical protein CROQUDRAFT_723200 [Cronartium quercuum f. sp. fusiforme G11]
MPLREDWIVILTLLVVFHLAIGEIDSSHPSFNAYAPKLVPCPPSFQARQTGPGGSKPQSIGLDEANYIASRRSKVIPEAYKDYFTNVETYVARVGAPATQLPPYVKKILTSMNQTTLPRLSLAVAGGAYRGALFGAGMMNVFDGRNVSSKASGLGGLLQAVEYVTGLSGSTWLVMSWMHSELAPIFELILGSEQVGKNNSNPSGWLTHYGLLDPTDEFPNDTIAQKLRNTRLKTSYWTRLIREVSSKRLAGFQIGIVDLWGRILSYHFLNDSSPDKFFNGSVAHGINQTFSGMVNLSSFRNFTQPFPILTTLPLAKGSIGILPLPDNATRYEITPYEFGSYDPFLSSFIPTRYLGTKLSKGFPMNKDQCCKNFDNAGFILATASNFFPVYKFMLNFYFNLRKSLAGYTPEVLSATVSNPFFGLGTEQFVEGMDKELHLIDGGFGFEVTPFAPLLVQARKVDVILAFDGTGDTLNFANGSSLVRTAERASHYSEVYKFPKVPLNVTDFTTLGLVKRPTFFGCEQFDAPLLIWIANTPPLDGSPSVLNTTTLQLTYPRNETVAMLNEALTVGTRGFPSEKLISQGVYQDPLWPACLSCAVVDRARGRLGVQREGICSACFDRHCWS